MCLAKLWCSCEFKQYPYKYNFYFSIDEKALIQGAQQYGFVFDTRTPHAVEIKTVFGREKYELLNVLEFTSARKRMSVIVRNANNQIILYCKVRFIKVLKSIPKLTYAL